MADMGVRKSCLNPFLTFMCAKFGIMWPPLTAAVSVLHTCLVKFITITW